MRRSDRAMDVSDDAIRQSLDGTDVVKITLMEPPTGKRKDYENLKH